jgi:hypothetical protein
VYSAAVITSNLNHRPSRSLRELLVV